MVTERCTPWEERAALIAEGCGVPRAVAERMASEQTERARLRREQPQTALDLGHSRQGVRHDRTR